MITQQNCVIVKREPAAPDTYTLYLEPERSLSFRPGQFLNLSVPGFALRRPISITDAENGLIRLTCRIVGAGTKALGEYTGATLSVLGPLGNGFALPEAGQELLVLGGGMGTAPLVGLIRAAVARGCCVTAIFGFRSPEQTLFQRELAALPVKAHFCYDSAGENVATVLEREGLADLPFAACGPIPMLRAVDEILRGPGQYSLECRMGCGFGACMGCSVRMRSGMRRICKDGPVFSREELLWESFR